MSDYTVDTFEDGDYRIRIEYDQYGGGDPREWDNVSEIVGLHPRYNIGDRNVDPDEQDAFERGGWKLLKRYLELSKHAIAICLIGMYDHSGISLYPMSFPDDFHGVDTQWDHSTAGFAYVTRESHEKNAGGDPFEEISVTLGLLRYATHTPLRGPDDEMSGTMQRVWANLYGEIKDYDDFVQGHVYGFIVEKRETWHKDSDPDEEREDWETVDSCWGFVGESEYAMAEAKATLESIKAAQKAVTA